MKSWINHDLQSGIIPGKGTLKGKKITSPSSIHHPLVITLYTLYAGRLELIPADTGQRWGTLLDSFAKLRQKTIYSNTQTHIYRKRKSHPSPQPAGFWIMGDSGPVLSSDSNPETFLLSTKASCLFNIF